MTRPYSEDLRERALLRADAGETIREIAVALQISPSCVSKWRKLRRETGGQRLDARVPHGHWKTLTFIGALRHDRIDASWVIDGPINGDIFIAYVKEVLAPTLSKGDIVILDNLDSYKGKAARKAIRAVGAHLIFLPAYSPDLNPIEQVFAKLKQPMRKAEPRTIEATWRKVGNLLDLFAPAECANYLRNSGYASV